MTTNTFEITLKAYLDVMARVDNDFAVKYANPKKSLKECVKYICNEMYNKARQGNIAIAVSNDDGTPVGEEDVFGLAVKYYTEDIDCSKMRDFTGQVVATIKDDSKPVKKAEKKGTKAEPKSEAKKAIVTKPITPVKATPQPKAKKPVESKQMDLFGDYNPFI